MEPPDASRTDDNTGSTRRRVSSILKAPRTSRKFSSPQQECQPTEKRRNSKRVSFAPANDVLLFSEKAKNGSPVRSPLQDLTATTENLDERLQMSVIEGGSQSITGMETLLNAPLHVSQHKHKNNFMLNDDAQNNYGDNTVMFTGDESAFMDVTHSHTVLISNVSESPRILESVGNIGVPASGNMDFTFTMNKSTSDSCTPTPLAQDSEFKDFLASLSKTSDSKSKPTAAQSSTSVTFNSVPPSSDDLEDGLFARLKTWKSCGDKENKAPAMSLTRRYCPVGSDASQMHLLLDETTMQTEQKDMDLTKSPNTWKYSNEMFKSGKAVRDEKQGFSDSTFRQSSYNADPGDMEMTRSQTVAIDSKTIGMIGSLRNERRKSVAFTQDPNRTQFCHYDRTVSDSDCGMDMTKPLTLTMDYISVPTVDIMIDDPKSRVYPSENQASTSSLGAEHSPGDMEMTRSQTVAIDSKTIGTIGSLRNERRKSVAVTQDPNRTQIFSNDNYGLELPKALNTPLQESMQLRTKQTEAPHWLFPEENRLPADVPFTVVPNQPFDRVCHYDRTVSDSDCGMDMTKPLTVTMDYIPGSTVDIMIKGPKSRGFPTENQVSMSSLGAEHSPGDMEMTRSQTVAIDSKTIGMIGALRHERRKSVAFTQDPNRTNIFSNDDNGLELTTALNTPLQERMQLRTKQTKAPHWLFPEENRSSVDVPFTAVPIQPFDRASRHDKTVSDSDYGMDMTKPLTVTMDHMAASTVNKMIDDPKSRVYPVENQASVSSFGADFSPGDMEITRSHTVVFDAKNLRQRFTEPSLIKETTVSLLDSNKTLVSLDDSSMEISQAFTAPIVENLFTSVNENKMIARQPTISNVTAEVFSCVKVGQGIDHPLSLNSDDMVMAKSQPVVSDGTNMEGNVSFREKNSLLSNAYESLGKNTIPTEQSVHIPVQFSAVGFCSDDPTSSEMDEMELKRGQTVAIECSANTLLKDDDMEMAKSVTEIIEQTDTPTHTKSMTKMFSSPLTNLGETNTSLADLSQKDRDRMQDPELTDGDRCILDQPDRSPIANSTSNQDQDPSEKVKNRRMSFADLQSKLQHISRKINESTEVLPIGSVTAPMSQLVRTSKTTSVETDTQPVDGCVSKTMEFIDDKDNPKLEDHHSPDVKHFMTAPLNLKSKCLSSRLSFGGFMPKLPQRNRPLQNVSSCMANVNKPLKTMSFGVTDELCSNTLVDNIDDEVCPNISSEEEFSEPLDTKSLQNIDGTHSDEKFSESVLKDVLVSGEPVLNVAQGQKRPLPEDCHEDSADVEKRKKPSTDNIEEPVVQWESNSSAAAFTLDGSGGSNSTNIRSEATFESTYRQSQFESQLEDTGDYTFDVRKKLGDGSITVTEFLKLFSIDFVIHKPRQSMLPARVPSDLDRKTEDLLIERHIHRPKQRVYEADCQKLTEMVEGLKARMREQDNLLISVNRALWEAMKGFSEKELQCFGAKLKERRNFFRKRSKVQSHEMKAVLYTNLVQTCQDAQQNLRGKIEKADVMLKDLDGCLHDLEAELASVEGEGIEDSEPTLKSRKKALENVNKRVSENERQMYELEIRKKHLTDSLDRLRTETRELWNHIDMLDRVNEWKFGEQDDDRAIYTFLHDSLHLEVQFEKSDGTDEVQEETEQNILDVKFQLQLDEQKSQCQSRLIHKLLSQYLGDETNWVKKYPTSRYVPKLLHDVGLVVSRCRLLGEEVHRLKKWGSVRLDVLDISCVDTQIRVLFSSLKAGVKFEITIGVTSTYPYCLLQVQDFQNHIGNTMIHQLEEIVFSVTPSKNYLTKIVKNIHDTLLC